VDTTRLTAQGQITVPAAVRRKLGVGPGSTLEALFPSPPKRRSLDELKAGLRSHAKRRRARR
jgi:AbrB family looped-hinge helix DNA binding protein